MSEQYLGEIRVIPFSFAPKGWAMCDGQTLPINQNQALFALLGNRYGGDGTTNFKLPDLRGRMPLHMGDNFGIGQAGGEEAHVLTSAEMPQHLHSIKATSALTSLATPAGTLLGTRGRSGRDIFAAPDNLTSLHPASVSQAGASQAHTNMQPFLGLNFVIALAGIFPSHN